MEILFLSSFTTSSGKFNKLSASNAILFQIKVFVKNTKKTTLARYFTKVIVHHSFQGRNQEFFRAGEFSWNLGTSINIHLQHDKERPRTEKFPGFWPGKF